MKKKLFLIISLLCLFEFNKLYSDESQNIVSDSTTNTRITYSDKTYDIRGGQVKGKNLFHSFTDFNLINGEKAKFYDDGFINNISRVTGKKQSIINGEISSHAVNFFFINPNGIIFGQNSNLNITGSFYASTSDYLIFKDKIKWSVDAGINSTFSTEPVSSFGFIDRNIKDIKIQSAILNVSPQNKIAIIGGNINIEKSELKAPAGNIILASIKSTGEFKLNIDQDNLNIFDELGDININNSVINISGMNNDNKGLIHIQSKNFFLYKSSIAAMSINGAGGNIQIYTDNNLLFSDESRINISTYLNSVAGNISINTKKAIFENSGISCHSDFGSKAGLLEINAKESLFLKNSSITATAYDNASKAGDIIINSEKVTIENYKIRSETESDVPGGNIIFKNLGDLKLKSVNITTESHTETKNAYGGDILLSGNIKNIYLFDSKITTSVKNGIGNAGHISIKKADTVVLSKSKIITQADKGAGGDIEIISENFIQSTDSTVDASSRLGVDGIVNISPDESIGQNLNVLSNTPLNKEKWLSKKCTQCSDQTNNSLEYEYVNGAPTPLDDWQASPQLPFQSKLIANVPEIKQGEEIFSKGHFNQAIILWNKAIKKITNKNNPVYPLLLLYMAKAYQNIGKYQKAISTIAKILPYDINDELSIKKILSDYDFNRYPASINALIFNRLSDLSLVFGKINNAETSVQIALEQARIENIPYILACVYNNKGNIQIANDRRDDALKYYEEAANILESIKNIPSFMIQSKVLLNWLRLNFNNPYYDQIEINTKFNTAIDVINKLTDSHQKFSDILSLGLLTNNNKITNQLFLQALSIAKKNKDLKSTSLAFGYLCHNLLTKNWEEDIENFNKTIKILKDYNRKAVFYAQSYPEYLYIWQWQQARLLNVLYKKGLLDKDKDKDTENINLILKSYSNALNTLTPIKSCFINGFHGNISKRKYFKTHIRQLFLEYIAFFLDMPKPNENDSKKIIAQYEKLTEKIITQLEKLKELEIDNYFDDECLVYLQSLKKKQRKSTSNSINNETAILYIIDLNDQFAVFLKINGKIFVKRVNNKKFLDKAQTFIACINRISDDYKRNAIFFYDNIIKPFETQLNEVKTILIVPDGIFRTIPFAALFNNDKNEFLIDKYALSILPSKELADSEPSAITKLLKLKNTCLEYNKKFVMVNGLSKKKYDNSEIKYVKDEVKSITQLIGGQLLLDEFFTESKFKDFFQQNDYSIVHIATHGKFDNYASNSYIQTYDKKINLDKIETLMRCVKYRDNQIELLTLSACQTALGDEWAAMGLAGVALKAGVKSAIASFWSVDDKTTSLLMKSFYQNLFGNSQISNKPLTKAEALQMAQKKVKNDLKLNHPHPYYWAGFLLIGNWL